MLSKARIPFSMLIAISWAGGCSRNPPPANEDGAVSADFTCPVALPTSCPSPSPRYADIAPIVQADCAGPCHSGAPGGPWPLTEYQHVADWADMIRPMVAECQMPPPDAGIQVSTADRLAILSWLRCGAPP
jgi:hypothetical protein